MSATWTIPAQPAADGGQRLITDAALARFPNIQAAPAPHTAAELATILRLLHASGARSVVVGHGRHESSRSTAQAVAAGWAAEGGSIVAVQHWPVRAASWLRPARHLAGSGADVIVIVDNPAGAAQLLTRLSEQPGWLPAATVAAASVQAEWLLQLLKPQTLDRVRGLRGATSNGRLWTLRRSLLVLEDAPPLPTPCGGRS